MRESAIVLSNIVSLSGLQELNNVKVICDLVKMQERRLLQTSNGQLQLTQICRSTLRG